MKRSPVPLRVAAAAPAALAVLTACGGGGSAASSGGTARDEATAALDLAVPSAVFAPEEEVATYAVGKAGLITEGTKRGLPLGRIAALTAWNPARRYGLHTKGRLAPGFDADLALVDPGRTWTVRAAESESAQEYTPFEGFELTARVTDTFLRGHHVLRAGKVTGEPAGDHLHRSAAPA
ncbi:amidohydrolase family protein [Streptomyces sp. NPDC059785]|uniref:amidohydrolase family protein n=1 Tax=Streptomyces sp. NPDC059785 TaxID=3346945 RepID=UPI00364FD2FA